MDTYCAVNCSVTAWTNMYFSRSALDSYDVRKRTAAADLGGIPEALQHPQDLRVLRLHGG